MHFYEQSTILNGFLWILIFNGFLRSSAARRCAANTAEATTKVAHAPRRYIAQPWWQHYDIQRTSGQPCTPKGSRFCQKTKLAVFSCCSAEGLDFHSWTSWPTIGAQTGRLRSEVSEMSQKGNHTCGYAGSKFWCTSNIPKLILQPRTLLMNSKTRITFP